MYKLILYGAGELGRRWLNRLGNQNVYAFSDSNPLKIGMQIQDKKVLSVEELVSIKDEIKIFISTKLEFRNEIIKLLKDMGLEICISKTPFLEEKNFFDLDTYIDDASVFEGHNVVRHDTHVTESSVGYASYIGAFSNIKKTKIGRYCSIGPGVKVVQGQHPTHKFVSTHPAFYSVDNNDILFSYVDSPLYQEKRYVGNEYAVEIGNDVWIGEDVKLMEGVTVADGTIIAAGAVVVKDTLPYSIMGGVPAKNIGERFAESEKNFLMKLQWWNKSEEWIRDHSAYFSDIQDLIEIVLSEQ